MTAVVGPSWQFERGEHPHAREHPDLAVLVASVFELEPDVARFAVVRSALRCVTEVVTPGYVVPDSVRAQLTGRLWPCGRQLVFSSRIADEVVL